MKLDTLPTHMLGRIASITAGSKFSLPTVVGLVKSNVSELVPVMKNVISDGDVDEE
jgi:hypothetical protein